MKTFCEHLPFLLLLLLLGCAPSRTVGTSAAASEPQFVFFVATNGNDSWSGKSPSPAARGTDGPFATVAQALRAVRTAKQQDPLKSARGPIISLRGGTYFLSEPLVIEPADSDLEISAYQDEHPVLSGGRPIVGWKEASVGGQKLWAVDVPEVRAKKWFFRELWVNGRRATRARHPNKGYLAIAEVPDKAPEWTQGQTRFRFSGADLKAWPGITNAEVVAMSRWVESRLPVVHIDEKERLISFGKRSVFELGPGDLYYLEHAFEALDSPGEWYLDREAGTLYYYPHASEQLARVQTIAPLLAQIVRLQGNPAQGAFVERVRFRGLTFSHAEWYYPEGFQSATNTPQVSPAPKAEVGGFAQAAIGVPGAVWGEGVRNCSFDHCTFANVGTYGLELTRGCQSNRVMQCEFADLGGGGLKIGETSIRANPAEQSRFNEISDCSIHDGGKMFGSAVGIWIGQSPDNVVTHNSIHDFYYTGISIGWTWGYGPALATNNLVTFNHVHHIGVKSDGDGPILSDMAGIYTLGKQPGTRIINNLWHDVAAVRYGGWGIYFDEGSSGIVAMSNLVYRTTHGGFHQHYGETNIVRNNIFAFARDHQIQRTRNEPHLGFTFETNIVYFASGTLVTGDWSGDNYRMDGNVYFDRRPAESAGWFGQEKLLEWQKKGHDLNSIVADPLFANPDQNDFRLRPDSPALQRGFQPLDLGAVGPRAGR